MPGFVIIIGLIALGAMVGFFFSKKGKEKEGAIKGAKMSCGCVLAFTLILIGAFIIFMLTVGGAI